jgi:putative salt-induced outer membrane protein YdiY
MKIKLIVNVARHSAPSRGVRQCPVAASRADLGALEKTRAAALRTLLRPRRAHSGEASVIIDYRWQRRCAPRRFAWLAVGWAVLLLVTAGATAQTNTATTTNAPIVTPPKTPPPPPAPKWEGSAAIGVTVTRGNSKTELFTVNIQTQKKTPREEWFLGGDAAYGENESVKNTETLHGFGQYNNLFDGRFYWGVRADAMHDGIAAIRYRLTLAPLAGFFLIKQTNTTLAVELGPGFVYQDQGDQTRGTMTVRAGERFEHKFSAKTRVWETFEILPQVDRWSYYVINAEIGVEAALNGRLSLRTYLQDTYYSIPAPGREKNDAKLVTAIAYKF